MSNPTFNKYTKELEALDVKEKILIKCADCGKDNLIVYVLDKVSELPSKIKTKCFCGGSSFIKTVTNKTKIEPASNLIIEDVKYTPENNLNVFILGEKK